MTKNRDKAVLLKIDGANDLQNERAQLALVQDRALKAGIPFEDAVAEFEAAYVKAAQAQHGKKYQFWARLRKDGRIELAQVLKVVENVNDEYRQVSLKNYLQHDPCAKVGQFVVNNLPPVHPAEFAGKLGQSNAIIQDVRIAEI